MSIWTYVLGALILLAYLGWVWWERMKKLIATSYVAYAAPRPPGRHTREVLGANAVMVTTLQTVARR